MGLDVYLSDGSAESPSSWGEDRVIDNALSMKRPKIVWSY
jgi:hypothetical protein